MKQNLKLIMYLIIFNYSKKMKINGNLLYQYWAWTFQAERLVIQLISRFHHCKKVICKIKVNKKSQFYLKLSLMIISI